MASSLHNVGRRTRAAPPARNKKQATKESPVDVTGTNGTDVVFVGGGTIPIAGYLSALRVLAMRGMVRVAALVGITESAASEIREAFPDAAVAESLDTLVIAPGALVLLASSPHQHPQQAGAALRRGWHVFSAAPLARSVRDATVMAATAKRNERLLAAALPHRFAPAVHYLRTLCRDQLIGPLVTVDIHDGGPIPPSSNNPGDGVLIDVGTYALDLLTWCIGTPAITQYADDALGGVEANAYLELGFPESVRATIHLSHDWPTSRRYEFVFERGVVQWRPTHASRLIVQLASAPAALDAQLSPVLGPAGEPEQPAAHSEVAHITAQLENILTGILHPESLQVSFSDALSALALVEHCHARRDLLEQPWLSHNEAAHARALSTRTELPRA